MATTGQPMMRAARFRAADRSLTIESVPVPTPGQGDVRVRVQACGICGSDASLVAGHLTPSCDVITPGHEAAGVIDAVGDGVPSGWTVGARVVLAPGRACRTCSACRRGMWSRCTAIEVLGFDRDGGFAEFTVVPFGALVALPDERPIEEWAVLADAVATPYAALVDTAGLHIAESVGIWGIGGLGGHAVQVARAMGAAPIIAMDLRASARARALALGADAALDPSAEEFQDALRDATGGRGLDVALDIVGATASMRQAVKALGPGGRAVVVGVTGQALDLGPAGKFVVRGRQVRGHLGYERVHLEQLVDLVRTGRLDFARSVSAVVGLDELRTSIDRLAQRSEEVVRIVVRPGPSGPVA